MSNNSDMAGVGARRDYSPEARFSWLARIIASICPLSTRAIRGSNGLIRWSDNGARRSSQDSGSMFRKASGPGRQIRQGRLQVDD